MLLVKQVAQSYLYCDCKVLKARILFAIDGRETNTYPRSRPVCEYKKLPEWQSHGVSWRQVDNKVDQYPRLTVKCLGLHGRWVVEVTVKYEPEGGVKVLSRPSSLCHPYGSPSSCTATGLRGVCVILYYFTQPRYAPVFRRARVFSSPHHPGQQIRCNVRIFGALFGIMEHSASSGPR